MTKLFLGEMIKIWVYVTWMENFPNGAFWWLVVYFQAYTFFGKKLEHVFLYHSPFSFEIGIDLLHFLQDGGVSFYVQERKPKTFSEPQRSQHSRSYAHR